MASYFQGEVMGAFLPGLFSIKSARKSVRKVISVPKLKVKRILQAPAAIRQQRLISTTLHGDEMMGAFLPGLFSAKLAKKSLAKIDPTSSKIGGKIVKSVIAGAAAVGGSLIGIPPKVTYGAVSGGLGAVGQIRGAQKSMAREVKAQVSAAEQSIMSTSSLPTDPSPQVGPAGAGGDQKKSFVLPLLGIGAAAVAALTMM